MAEQYNFMSGASGSLPMGAFQRARQTDAASRDPYYQLNTAIKQHELEAARWTMHAKAFDMQRQVMQRQGISEISGIMAAGSESPNSMLHSILKTANRYGLDDDQIKQYTTLAEQMANRDMAARALGVEAPEGMRKEFTFGPSGASVSFKSETSDQKWDVFLQRADAAKAEAERLRAAGDVEGYQAKMQEHQENMGIIGGQQTSIFHGQGPAGEPIFEFRQGPGVAGMSATPAARGFGEKSTLQLEAASKSIAQAMRVMTPEVVGPAGWLGEAVVDKTLGIVFPDLVNQERVAGRQLLRNVRHSILRMMQVNEGRLFKDDIRAIETSISTDAFITNPTYAKVKLQEIQNMFVDRARTYAAITPGETVPTWAMTREEIQEEYSKKQAAWDNLLAEGKVTPQQAQASLGAERERIVEVMEMWQK